MGPIHTWHDLVKAQSVKTRNPSLNPTRRQSTIHKTIGLVSYKQFLCINSTNTLNTMMMAHRLSRSLRRATTIRTIPKTLIQEPSLLHSYVLHEDEKLNFLSRRSYITEMQKSAFEGNILRLLRNEIRYELEHSPPTQVLLTFAYFSPYPLVSV